MKRKIKLRDMTKEQWDKNRDSLCKFKTMQSCDECIFKWVNCLKSSYKQLWIYHKDLYSEKFLNQEIEIEESSILDEEEKEYLSAVLKPFINNVTDIAKYRRTSDSSEYIVINFKDTEGLILPHFKENTMYKGMELDKKYTLAELGL